jgi:hypothetical protein
MFKKFVPRAVHTSTIMASAVVLTISAAGSARADDDAAKILKSANDYMAAQKAISASFDSDIEVITPDLQKIQFASSGQIKLSRPDKLKIRRTGGYADVELTYDGPSRSTATTQNPMCRPMNPAPSTILST